jgi:predicted amidophosphoribosyltransferase
MSDCDDDLGRCPHCGAEVYLYADRCPACGDFITPELRPRRSRRFFIVLAAALAALLLWLLRLS